MRRPENPDFSPEQNTAFNKLKATLAIVEHSYEELPTEKITESIQQNYAVLHSAVAALKAPAALGFDITPSEDQIKALEAMAESFLSQILPSAPKKNFEKTIN